MPLLSAVDDPGATGATATSRGSSGASRAAKTRRRAVRAAAAARSRATRSGEPRRRARAEARHSGRWRVAVPARAPGSRLLFPLPQGGRVDVLGAFKQAGCHPKHEEWTLLRRVATGAAREAAYSLTNVWDPVARLLSAHAPQARRPSAPVRTGRSRPDCSRPERLRGAPQPSTRPPSRVARGEPGARARALNTKRRASATTGPCSRGTRTDLRRDGPQVPRRPPLRPPLHSKLLHEDAPRERRPPRRAAGPSTAT